MVRKPKTFSKTLQLTILDSPGAFGRPLGALLKSVGGLLGACRAARKLSEVASERLGPFFDVLR
eukprot:8212937-Pyramimonas_sp.AAC.1